MSIDTLVEELGGPVSIEGDVMIVLDDCRRIRWSRWMEGFKLADPWPNAAEAELVRAWLADGKKVLVLVGQDHSVVALETEIASTAAWRYTIAPVSDDMFSVTVTPAEWVAACLPEGSPRPDLEQFAYGAVWIAAGGVTLHRRPTNASLCRHEVNSLVDHVMNADGGGE